MVIQRYNLCDYSFPGCSLDIKPGNVLVIYTDEGPGGPCGQSMSVTCPHAVIHLFPSEDSFREYMEKHGSIGRNKKADIRYVIIGEYGTGQIGIVNHLV